MENLHFSEIILLLYIYLSGFLFSILLLKKEKNILFLHGISIFTGISLFFFVFFPVLVLFKKINLEILWGIGALKITCLLFLVVNKCDNLKEKLLPLFLSIPLYCALGILFQEYDFNLACGDTFHLSKCSIRCSISSQSFMDNISCLSSWGAVLVLIQYVSYKLGIIYLSSLFPILLISFILCFQALLYKALMHMKVNHRMGLVSSISAAFLLTSIPIFLKVILLVHTNTFLTYYMFLFVAFYWFGEALKEKEWYYLAFIYMVTAAFSRVEAPIYCTVFLCCMLFKDYSEQKIIINKNSSQQGKESFSSFLIFTFFGLLGLWYGGLYFVGADTDILSNKRALFLLFVFMGMPLALFLLETKYFTFIRKRFLNFLNLSVMGILFVIYILFSEHLLSSLNGMYQNFSNDFWHGFIFFIASSIVFLILKKRTIVLLEKSILTSIFLISSNILIFSLFRTPFYNTLYDSSNRLFTTFIPLVIFYLTLKMCPTPKVSYHLLTEKINNEQ